MRHFDSDFVQILGWKFFRDQKVKHQFRIFELYESREESHVFQVASFRRM